MVIYKYELNWEFPTTLELPFGYEILDIQEQAGVPVLWALVDLDAPNSFLVKITPYFTGIHGVSTWNEYIKTIQRTNTPLVYHFFKS